MFSLSFIINVLVAHYISDFILQSDEMALNKSKSNIALLYHVLVYQASLNLALTPVWMYANLPDRLDGPMIYWLFNAFSFAAHFVTDYWTSRLNSKLWLLPSKHWFFVGIGFDQFIHYATLFSLLHHLRINF